MRHHYTDSEIRNALSELTIIADSREQINQHILTWLDGKGVQHITRALETGDYSAMLDGETFEDEVVVERKANIDEIAGNFTQGRERFEREMIRAKANGIKVFLIIENASWHDILLHNYHSQLKPQSLMASLLSWQVRYNITVMFCRSDETAQLIYSTLYYRPWNRLKRG